TPRPRVPGHDPPRPWHRPALIMPGKTGGGATSNHHTTLATNAALIVARLPTLENSSPIPNPGKRSPPRMGSRATNRTVRLTSRLGGESTRLLSRENPGVGSPRLRGFPTRPHQPFLHRRGHQGAVPLVELADIEATAVSGPVALCPVVDPIVDIAGLVEPHAVVEAGGLHPVVVQGNGVGVECGGHQ